MGSLRVSERLWAPVCAGFLSLPLYSPPAPAVPTVASPAAGIALLPLPGPALPRDASRPIFVGYGPVEGLRHHELSCLSRPSPTARSLHAVNTAAWSDFYVEVPEVWLLN